MNEDSEQFFSDAPKEETAKPSSFMQELTELINAHSMENESNTPDYMLAKFLERQLESFNEAIIARDKWYGFSPFGGKAETPALEQPANPERKMSDTEIQHARFMGGIGDEVWD